MSPIPHAQLAHLEPHQMVRPDVPTCFQQPVQVLRVTESVSRITPASQALSAASWQHHCLPAVSQQRSLRHRWAPSPSLQASQPPQALRAPRSRHQLMKHRAQPCSATEMAPNMEEEQEDWQELTSKVKARIISIKKRTL